MFRDDSHIGIVNTAARNSPPDAPYFYLEFQGQADADELVFTAGVCSEGGSDVDMEIRRYAITLLLGFFARKGREFKSTDYRQMLQRILHHIHEHITTNYGGKSEGLDMALAIANTSRTFAARCGKGDLFLFGDGEARSLFKAAGSDALLGAGGGEVVEVEEAPIEPGNIVVVCNPAVAKVIGAKDVTVILRRASDPVKAGLFLSAIAERKGAEGPLVALLWEVPNYQGAAMLTEEAPPAGPEGPVVEEQPGEEGAAAEPADQADQAKRQWLSKWRRYKEPKE